MDEVPVWSCSQFGNYEHDWLDCFDCLEKYENYLEEEQIEEKASQH